MTLDYKKLIIINIFIFALISIGLIVKNPVIGAISLLLFLLFAGTETLLLLNKRKFSGGLFLVSLGLSLGELIILGLLTNFLFFLTTKPLEGLHIFTVLITSALFKSIYLYIKKSKLEFSYPVIAAFDFLPISLSIISITLAILGAIRLNNGFSNELSLIAIVTIIINISILILFNKKLSSFGIQLSLYFTSLTFLFMVSLRSWGISGHDIRSEYNVYLKTLVDLRWSIDNLRDAYNACMSITVFPIVISQLFYLSGYIFFKIFAQVIFAFVPLLIYLHSKYHSNNSIALFSSLFFITFPTFLIDSPMIVRQEIGFLFFGLIILLWFGNLDLKINTKKFLFIIFSVLLILSHYSSAYIFLAILTIFMLIKYIVLFFVKKEIFKDKLLTPILFFIILIFAILWYSQITGVSSGLTGIIIKSIKDIPNIYSQDNRDGSVNYIFLRPAVNQGEQISNYTQRTKVREDINPSISYYPETSSSTFARWLNTFYYSIGPKIYILLVALSLILLIFNKKIKGKYLIKHEYVLISIIGVVLIFFQIILPNLSLSYGLMRAFQQVAIFLSFPVAIIIYFLTKNYFNVFSTLFITLLLIIYTGLLNNFVHGVPYEYTLHNEGPYFNSYYYALVDFYSINWILDKNRTTNKYIHSNKSGILLTNYAKRFNVSTNILPFQVPQNDNIVILNIENNTWNTYVSINGKLIPVRINLSDYGHRSILYSNNRNIILGKEY